MVEGMQQPSATPSLHLGFLGLRKIVACPQPYLAVASCIYSFWHGVIPSSYLIFTLVLLQELHCLQCLLLLLWCVHIKVCSNQVSSLLVLVSYMAIYVPIVMYGLRLFIVVLQELQCLTNCLHVSIIRVIGVYQFTKYFACLHLQVFEIAKCIA